MQETSSKRKNNRKQARDWYAANPEYRERKRERMRAWRQANQEKVRAQKAAWYVANPDQHKADRVRARQNRNAKLAIDPEWYRKRGRLKKYGLSHDEIEKQLAAQNWCCSICSRAITAETAKVDHNHKNMDVRGLLCQSCNLGLGHFKDDIDKLFSAIQYLRGYDEHARRTARQRVRKRGESK